MSKLSSGYGFISLLYSISENPLALWSKHISTNGRIRRVEDDTLNGDRVIEIRGPEDYSTINTNISCPANPDDFLNIQLPVLVIVLKDLKSRVQIVFQLIDEEHIRRKFILTTCGNGDNKPASVEPATARLVLKLAEGWNSLEINLRTLCQTIYRTDYRALQRLIIYPNCRIRRIYLQDRHYEHNETPMELCQAFFDMYMLKWGINFVEQSCQTDETSKGVKSGWYSSVSFHIHNILLASFHGNNYSVFVFVFATLDEKQLVSLKENPIIVARLQNTKSKPSDKTANAKFTRPTPGKELSQKKNNSHNVLKSKISKTTEHPEESKEEKSSSAIDTTPLKVEKILEPNKREGEIFRKWPYGNYVRLQKIVSQKESDKFKFIEPVNMGLKNATLPDKKSTGLTFIKGSAASVAAIPSQVLAEASAATKNVEYKKSKLLTTDEAVGNVLELRHQINKKMLDNLHTRGFTMTEVELSIYNSKHRRNSYGQGKIVEKHRMSVDKACNVVPTDSENEKKMRKSAGR